MATVGHALPTSRYFGTAHHPLRTAAAPPLARLSRFRLPCIQALVAVQCSLNSVDAGDGLPLPTTTNTRCCRLPLTPTDFHLLPPRELTPQPYSKDLTEDDLAILYTLPGELKVLWLGSLLPRLLTTPNGSQWLPMAPNDSRQLPTTTHTRSYCLAPP